LLVKNYNRDRREKAGERDKKHIETKSKKRQS
jgi:hypothetical protein